VVTEASRRMYSTALLPSVSYSGTTTSLLCQAASAALSHSARLME
jgi:hypothetical protein